jgi:methionyl-tRNA formyltransferase
LRADLMVVAAYGLLLPAAVLSAPRLGCVNIHASLLPRWRGASPIQQAILAGDAYSGISLMQMDTGLDTGNVICSRRLAIEPDWNAGQLHDALAPLGAELLLEALEDIEAALRQSRAQDDSEATYAPRLSKQQAEADWSKPAARLLREVRAYNPWPVSYSYLDGETIRLWSACADESHQPAEPGRVVAHERDGVYVSCADGVLRVTELQFAGRRRCSAAQALDARDLGGCRLGGKG